MAGLTEFKQILLTTLSPTAGQVMSTKLPSQMAWTHMQFRVSGTWSGGVANNLRITQDADLNVLTRIQLRANGRPVWELPVPDAFYRHNFQQKTAGSRTSVPTAIDSGSFNFGFVVPFSLPHPSLFPQRHATIFPAGLINNIELLITTPASFTTAVFSTAGAASVTLSGVSVSALAIDLSSAELRKLIAKGGHGYIQTQTLQNVTAAGNSDVELTGGRGALKDLYWRVSNNKASSGTNITTQRLLIGNNEFPVDSQMLELQDESRRLYSVETLPGNTADTTTGATNTAGSAMICFNPDSQLNHGINLVGKPSFKLRNTWVASPALVTPNISVIQGLFDPHFFQTIL